jgi:hypothetical protein
VTSLDKPCGPLLGFLHIECCVSMEVPGFICVREQGVIFQHFLELHSGAYCRILESALGEVSHADRSKEGVGMGERFTEKSSQGVLSCIICGTSFQSKQ